MKKVSRKLLKRYYKYITEQVESYFMPLWGSISLRSHKSWPKNIYKSFCLQFRVFFWFKDGNKKDGCSYFMKIYLWMLLNNFKHFCLLIFIKRQTKIHFHSNFQIYIFLNVFQNRRWVISQLTAIYLFHFNHFQRVLNSTVGG